MNRSLSPMTFGHRPLPGLLAVAALTSFAAHAVADSIPPQSHEDPDAPSTANVNLTDRPDVLLDSKANYTTNFNDPSPVRQIHDTALVVPTDIAQPAECMAKKLDDGPARYVTNNRKGGITKMTAPVNKVIDDVGAAYGQLLKIGHGARVQFCHVAHTVAQGMSGQRLVAGVH